MQSRPGSASRERGRWLSLWLRRVAFSGIVLPLAPMALLQSTANPFAGAKLYVDPNSNAARQAEALKRSKPQDAALVAKIAHQPVARWEGGWVSDIAHEVQAAVSTIVGSGSLPVFVAYNIPSRDCGSFSAGGSKNADAYRKWISDFARGIGGRKSIVILEPDALPGMDCLDAAGKASRIQLMREAVGILKAQNASVYIDAGHAQWQSAETMAARLKQVDIAHADGFSLNVSNYVANDLNIAYGEKLSALLGGKHYIIDTSRNGANAGKDWCNPRNQALGVTPTTNTGHPLIDAFLWVKQPGESDGTCNGGPKAGSWWTDIAVEMSKAATALGRVLP